jgi:hypothetical protein
MHVTPYERGYEDAVAVISSIAFFIWVYGKTIKGEMFKWFPYKWRAVAPFLGTFVFYLLISYAVIPIIRFLLGSFAPSD